MPSDLSVDELLDLMHRRRKRPWVVRLWDGTLDWGLLATITGPVILAQAIKDWYR